MGVQLVMYDEEHRAVTAVCERLCRDANANVVFVIDKSGQLLASAGDVSRLDSTSMASLVAGEIAATGGLAQLMGEREFSTVYHEGARDHIHISIVASRVILVVIFDGRSSLGLVRLRVRRQSEELGAIFERMAKRRGERPAALAEITDEDIDNLFSI